MEKKKINWKVRFKNKIWLTAFISLIVGFVFDMLALFDVYPAFTQSTIMEIVSKFLTFLGLFGVIVDPTTEGLYDSERALTYEEPYPNGDTEEHEEDSPEDSESEG